MKVKIHMCKRNLNLIQSGVFQRNLSYWTIMEIGTWMMAALMTLNINEMWERNAKFSQSYHPDAFTHCLSQKFSWLEIVLASLQLGH